MNQFSGPEKHLNFTASRNLPSRKAVVPTLLTLGILVVIGYVSLLDFLPPIARDALIHHLAIPKIWLEAGGFVETSWAEFSYYPMNIQLLYLFPLAFNADWLANFIHHGFGLMTGTLIFLFLRRRLSVAWALLGALMFISTPAVIRTASSAYVDLGLAFFFSAAVFSLTLWQETRRQRCLILSAVAMGLAMGTKYQGMIGFPIIVAIVVWYGYKSGDGHRRALPIGGLYCLIGLAVLSPWLIKNYVLTGNPLYPFFNSFFGAESATFSEGGLGVIERRILVHGETPWEAILVPIRFFLDGKDFSPAGFDGVLNPVFLFIPPLALLRDRYWEIKPLSLVCVFWILVLFLMSAHVNRYLIPILPFTAVLVVHGLKEISKFLSRRVGRRTGRTAAALIVGLALAWNVNWMVWFWNYIDPLPFLEGTESKEAFLSRHLPYYPVVRCLNERTEPTAKVAALFMGNQGYYYERNYIYQGGLSGRLLDPIVMKAGSPEDIRDDLDEMGITHLMVREDLLIKYLNDNYSRKQNTLLSAFWNVYLKPMCGQGPYMLYQLVEPISVEEPGGE